MFHEHLNVHDGEETHPLGLYVSTSERLPMVFQFWAAELARDVLRLGVYFRAVAIMLQIPGAAEYQWARDEECDEDDEQADITELIAAAGENEMLDVLAECLDRLGAKHLMEQVTTAKRRSKKLSAEWRAMLDRREEVANGLLTVAAACLDALVVEPGMREIDKADEPHWWQRFRVKMRPFELPTED